jgi:hypothetical protein
MFMAMIARYDSGKNKITVEIDCNPTPVMSATGKSLIVASSGGNKTIANVDGKELKLGINAFLAIPENERKTVGA